MIIYNIKNVQKFKHAKIVLVKLDVVIDINILLIKGWCVNQCLPGDSK